MQIPLMSGVTASERAEFHVSYPVNLEPVVTDSGISKGFLRSTSGARAIGTGPGIDRGGINWNGVHYRVMGDRLVTIADGAPHDRGSVGGDGPVTLDYGFSKLAIRSGSNVWLADETTLVQITDPDLGKCVDLVWMDGYFVSTDGTNILITELNDPTSIDAAKYGSAEQSPDAITGLGRLRNELLVFGAETIEFFTDQGGSYFPFEVSTGATIPIGCVGPLAKARFLQSYAFVGAGRNQGIGVWIAGSGSADKLSPRAIDDMLAAEPDPSLIQIEARVSRNEQRLLIHLSDRTLVYLADASKQAQDSVWYVAQSGRAMDKPYRLRNAVLVDNLWIVGDTESAALGVLDDAVASHFGEAAGWRFDTSLIYNQAKGGIVHALELIGLPGRGDTSDAFLSMTQDGVTWTQERAAIWSKPGDRTRRCAWRPHSRVRHYMGMRFRGDGASLTGFAALEAQIVPLRV